MELKKSRIDLFNFVTKYVIKYIFFVIEWVRKQKKSCLFRVRCGR